MVEDIRFAIIGHGFMGHEHEKMLSDFPGIKLVGISDRDPAQLEDVKEGSIYPLLVRLEKKGMISSELRPSPLGPKRKYYSLTAEGEAYLQEFIKCWTEVQSSVNKILKKEG